MATEQSQKLVTITAKAAEKIKEFMAEETDKPEFLRIYVQGGGCSGLSYGMGFEKAAEDDDLNNRRKRCESACGFDESRSPKRCKC